MLRLEVPTPDPAKPRLAEYFDYQSPASHAGLSLSQLAILERAAAADYPGDLMMIELRLLRTCNAICSGAISATEADALAQTSLEGNQGLAA